MLTADEVEEVANLARIDLSEEEVRVFQTDLSKVLVFFTELEGLNTDHEKNIGHITGRINEARPDTVKEAYPETIKGIQNNFPESETGYLKVRSVF